MPFSRQLGSGCALILICFAAAVPAAAQYRFDTWTTDDGLPQNSVYSILQTRDGYLWFTTLDGLVRYNGAQFTVFNKANTSGFASLRFSSLYEDRDGNLWIGSEDGALTRYRAGSFTTYTTEQGLPHNYVGRIGQTADGALPVRTPQGLARFQNERFEVVAPDPNDFASEVGYRGASGAVWYRRETDLRRVSDGRLTVYQAPPQAIRASFMRTARAASGWEPRGPASWLCSKTGSCAFTP
jgi:ligand-binding sensor domain-containing protein